MKKLVFLFLIVSLVMSSCKQKPKEEVKQEENHYKQLLDQFAEVTLTADLSHLSQNEKEVIKLLIEACKIMDDLFWVQAYGDKNELLSKINDEYAKKYAMLHYGPWDRLNDNKPFLPEFGEKPAGANFYPADMTKEEFEKWDNPHKTSQYTMIRRNKEGKLEAIWYKDFFAAELNKVIDLLNKAAELTENKELKNYILKRIQALKTDDYFESDMAWMDVKTSNIDFIIGPIENYEDKLFGYKTAYEGFVLVKDIEWSKKLEKFTKMLPELQKSLPVEDKYKKEIPGTDSDINVYQALYYAGDCNAGSKSIAINLPNDERVHLKKGSRKLQLKNTMQAKFDKILVPIANLLIAEEQRKHIKFNAFFENVMFHEVAHGMGIKNVVGKKMSVREALKESYSPIEEAKADIMGLYLVTKLREKGELSEGELMDNYVTFVASIFRSIRFGAASAHGKANMIRFNYFIETGAIERKPDGTYLVNFDKMQEAVKKSVEQVLIIQGNGDYEAATKLIKEKSTIPSQLQEDLNRVKEAKIPVDIILKQGIEVLGI